MPGREGGDRVLCVHVPLRVRARVRHRSHSSKAHASRSLTATSLTLDKPQIPKHQNLNPALETSSVLCEFRERKLYVCVLCCGV